MSDKDFGELGDLPRADLEEKLSAHGPYARSEALDLVDQIETWGRSTLYGAIDKADRGSAQLAHTRVAELLESLSRSVEGRDADRIRKLAGYWRLIGEALPGSVSGSSPGSMQASPGTSSPSRSRSSINSSIDHTATAGRSRYYNHHITDGPSSR